MIYVVPIIVMILVVIYFYFFFRRLLVLFHIEKKRRLSKVLGVILTLSCILSVVKFLGAGFVILLFLLMSCLFTDILNLIFGKVIKKEGIKTIWKNIYGEGMLAIVIAALWFGYGYIHAKNVVVTNYTIETSKDIGSKGLKIAMISDLHMGTTMDAETLGKYCREIEDSNPDIFVLVGDIFDESTSKEDMETASKLLGSVSSKYGTYYVYGNHEIGNYRASTRFTKNDIEANLTADGIKVLDDKAILVNNSFYLVGKEKASIAEIFRREVASASQSFGGRSIDKSKFLLLLDHEPAELQKSAQEGVDLQLSGHTHGGQIWPFGTLSELLKINELNYGYKNIGGYQIIVSSGIGGWGYPVRTESTAEIVMVDVEHK
ncbi:MAG: metallophosphoesterase [Clostridiaceae bacterium]